MRYFEGSWTGSTEGWSGVGHSERTYEFVIGDVFLHWRNRSTFEPQEKNPEGEVHEDWGMLSYDKGRELFVLRQFNVEGFVNTYVLDTVADNGERLVYTTEDVENAPEGMGARLIVTIVDEDHFNESFQLAFPGKDFATCSENTWTRAR
jgi:hypothetical protein